MRMYLIQVKIVRNLLINVRSSGIKLTKGYKKE